MAQRSRESDPVTTQHHNKGRKLPIEVLSVAEYVALLGACGHPRITSTLRNRALLAVLYGAGLRVAEALALFPKDIDDGGAIRVLHGKGAKARTVGIDIDNLALVHDWIERRHELGLGPLAPLICTYSKPRPGRPIDSSQVRQLLPRLGRLAGITKRVHAHGLRHSLAAQLDDEHVPTRIIKDQLGHSSINTTSGYLEHLNPHQVIAAVSSRRPLAAAIDDLRHSPKDKP